MSADERRQACASAEGVSITSAFICFSSAFICVFLESEHVMIEAIQNYLAMGGYAAFVWPAYALAAIVLIGLLAGSLRQLRKAEAELAALGLQRPRERA